MSNIFKGLSESSLADQMLALARLKNPNARLAGTPEQERERTQQMLKQREIDRANQPKPTYSPEQIEKMKQQLAQAKQGFDPNYEYSDDYSFWKQQSEKSQTIRQLTKILKDAGAELDETKEADYGDEYQQMVKRVGQKAKEGPRKTVYDPVTRKYKTVPVKQSAIKQGVKEGGISNIEYKKDKFLKNLIAKKQKGLEYLEKRGINPETVGNGVQLEPPENLEYYAKVDFYIKQIENILYRLESDRKSFPSQSTMYQKQKGLTKKRSGPVTTMTGDEYKLKQGVTEEELEENLHKWFKEKWVRFGPDGKIRGDCARGDDSEGKPKCLPQAKAHALGKKGRKYAASKKRREDPNPERRGPAKNVATKKKSNEGVAEGSNDTVYPNAEVIKSKNGKPVGEIYQDESGWGCLHYKADRGYDTIDSREDAIQALKDIHSETGRSRPDYTIKGVAEGSLEEIDRRGFLKGLGAAAVAGAAGGALAQSKPADISAELARMTKDDPRIQHNKDVNELARAIYERMVAERGQPMDRRQQQQWLEIARLKAEERFSQYAPGKPSTTKPSAGFPSQPSEYRRSRNLDNFESVDQGVAEGSISTYILNVMDEATGEHWAIEIQASNPEMAKERARQQGYKVLRIKEKGLAEDQLDELKCWSGYTRVQGVPAGAPGSCKKKTNEEELEEYGNTKKGQKMLTKVQKRAVDRMTSKQADTDPKYAKKNQDNANAAWERMSDKDLTEEKCPHCGGPMFSEMIMNEKKDACYYKVKSRYKVWPSAYASGALVKCRKSHGKWGSGGKKDESVEEAKKKAVPSSERDPGALATRSHIASQEKKHSNWQERQKELEKQFYANYPELDDRKSVDEGTDDKEYRNWNEYEYELQQKAGKALEYLNEIDPSLFTRYGDEFLMNLAGKISSEYPTASVMQVAGGIVRHLKQNVGEGQIYMGGNKPAGMRWYKPRNVPNQDKLSKESAIMKGLQLEGNDKEHQTGGSLGTPYPSTYEQETLPLRTKGQRRTQSIAFEDEQLDEKWSEKYKRSIDCSHPKGFSQKAHCQGRKKDK